VKTLFKQVTLDPVVTIYRRQVYFSTIINVRFKLTLTGLNVLFLI